MRAGQGRSARGLSSAGFFGREWLPGGHELGTSGMYRVLVAAVGIHDVYVACGWKVPEAQERDLGAVWGPRRTEFLAGSVVSRV